MTHGEDCLGAFCGKVNLASNQLLAITLIYYYTSYIQKNCPTNFIICWTKQNAVKSYPLNLTDFLG